MAAKNTADPRRNLAAPAEVEELRRIRLQALLYAAWRQQESVPPPPHKGRGIHARTSYRTY